MASDCDCVNCKNARWNKQDSEGRIWCSAGRGYEDPAAHEGFCRCSDYDPIKDD